MEIQNLFAYKFYFFSNLEQKWKEEDFEYYFLRKENANVAFETRK